jgi:hemerythrin-like domain-containing protein
MSDLLFKSAPDFDQPIAVLMHCHDKIRTQLRTMQNMVDHLCYAKNNFDIQQAAKAVLRYFNTAARQHHEDEEENLLPVLADMAQGEDNALLNALLPEIINEHEQLHALWEVLNAQLNTIASGISNVLSSENVNRFSNLYAAHMDKEETRIAPMAKRLLNREQMHALGNAMRTRRGIAIPDRR